MTELSTAATAIKAASSLYSSRKAIVSFLYSGVKLALSSHIIVTGVAGVGKSFLLDFMNQEMHKRLRVRPEQSVRGEDYILHIGNGFTPKKVTVIPGQLMAVSDRLLNKTMSGSSLRGIIHLLDFGYNVPRDEHSHAVYESKGIFDVEALRKQNHEEEIQYLEGIVSRIKSAKCKPTWFCLVLSKCDLYKPSEAIKFYQENERFNKAIEEIYSMLGEGQVKLFIPVCSDISTITFGKKSIHPQYVKNNSEAIKLLLGMLMSIEMLDS